MRRKAFGLAGIRQDASGEIRIASAYKDHVPSNSAQLIRPLLCLYRGQELIVGADESQGSDGGEQLRVRGRLKEFVCVLRIQRRTGREIDDTYAPNGMLRPGILLPDGFDSCAESRAEFLHRFG